MPERRNIASGAAREDSVGYSRAVRVGGVIAVAGTASTGPYGRLASSEGAYRQARQALEQIEAALTQAGSRLEDVIRTRIYVTNIVRDGASVGRAHREVFHEIRPASTMVEVSRLIDKKMLVEIEAEAVAGSP